MRVGVVMPPSQSQGKLGAVSVPFSIRCSPADAPTSAPTPHSTFRILHFDIQPQQMIERAGICHLRIPEEESLQAAQIGQMRQPRIAHLRGTVR